MFDYNSEEDIKPKGKAKCKTCLWLNKDFIIKVKREENYNFCGLHGGAEVDINGDQPNFDSNGSCGYAPKEKQLKLF